MAKKKIAPSAKKAKKFEPIIVGNWKMNLFYQETEDLIAGLKENLKVFRKDATIIVCPSFPYLDRAHELLIASKIKLGAQDVFWEKDGNFTGEVSVKMLKELGCQYVIIGHSERRGFLGETDEMIDRKAVSALRSKLTPIICVGETKEERRQGIHYMIIHDQVKKALRYVNPVFQNERLIIAYEPVWSIYPGQPCEPNQAKEFAMVIHQALIDLYPHEVVEKSFRVIYGGSINEKNVLDYVDGEHFSGVLVGNASLDADSFTKIIKKF